MTHPGGRPTLYKESYCDDIIDFFNIPYTIEVEKSTIDKSGNVKTIMVTVANELPTLEAYAQKIGVHIDTLFEWRKQHSEFSESIKRAQTMQKAMWQANSLQGLYRDAFTIFMGKNVFGWTDKMDISTTTSSDQLSNDDIKAKLDALKKERKSTDTTES